jgi:hypothetical protein
MLAIAPTATFRRPTNRRLRFRSVVLALLATLAVGSGLEAATAPAAQAAGEGVVYASPFNSTVGLVVQIRKGGYDFGTDKGYGYAKICLKHNLCTLDGLRFAYSSTNVQKVGSYWNMNSWVRRWVNGQLQSEVQILAVFNPNTWYTPYYGYEVGGRMGAMTAYCVNYWPTCPSWVATAAAQAWANRASGARTAQATPARSGVSYTVSYQPMR